MFCKTFAWKYQYHWNLFLLFVLIGGTDHFTSVASDLLSDDFLSGDLSSKPHSTSKQGSQKLEPRHVEPGSPCLSVFYTHRKSRTNDHSKMEKLAYQSDVGAGDKMQRFDQLEELKEIRCAPEEGPCPSTSSVINVTLSRPEQREGARLVGDSDGDVFTCYPLSDMDFRRSRTAVPGNIKRLLDVARRARAGMKINVVVIGGSVSHGGACKSYMFEESDHKDPGPCSWANRFVIWMRQHYHNPNIHLISLAQPATTTTWSLTHFDRVLKRNPDLLLVEYGVNDAIVSSSESGKLQYTHMMRAATELLIRKFLQHNEAMKTNNAILYVVLQRSFDERTYFYPSEVYYPVCEEYGVPVVSVRDAIWPDQHVKKEQLWVTKAGAHPIWFGHQLICDILAYAWTMSEYEGVSGLTGSPVPPVTGTNLKFAAESSQVDACANRNIVEIKQMTPVRHPGKGWEKVSDRGKEGWEYDLHHQTGLSIEWAPGSHEHELSGRRLRSGLVRKKSKRVARAYGLMQGMDNSVLEGMESDLKGSDDWIPKGEISEEDVEEVSEVGKNDEKGEQDDEYEDDRSFESLNFKKKKIAPKKRDGKSMMGIRQRNKKKKEVEGQAVLARITEDREYVTQYNQGLGEALTRTEDFSIEKLWSPTPSPVASQSVTSTAAPTSQINTAIPGIISFYLNFTTAHNNTPTLLVEYLKSWTGYGQAVVWVTKKFDSQLNHESVVEQLERQGRHMLKMALANSHYVDLCKSMVFDDHSKLRYSPSCSHIRAGTWVDPSVIEGHWDDHSSQIMISHRVGALVLESDPHINSSPLHAVINPSASIILTIDDDNGDVPNLSISDLYDDDCERDIGEFEAEVHLMMVPWSHKKHGTLHQTKFKVSALYSC